MSDHHASSGNEAKILGVTHDPVLRPIGILTAVVGATWALFAGMALEAGTYHEPMAAVGLITLGALMAVAGGHSEQI